MRPPPETIPFSTRILNWWQNIPQRLRAAAVQPSGSASAGEAVPEARLPSTLEAYLRAQPHLPANSMIVGMGRDGLPFIIDLQNPIPGSMLILGDANSGKSALLKAMFTSAVKLNPPDGVRLTLLVEHPQEYMSLFQTPHCATLCSARAQRIGKVVAQLFDESESRRQSRQRGAVLLLGLDDLATCLAHLEAKEQQHLHWLIKHGAKYGLWTVATLSTTRLKDTRPEFLSAFRTRLYGSISSREVANQIGAPSPVTGQKLRQGNYFTLPYGEGWERLYPLPGEENLDHEAQENLEGES